MKVTIITFCLIGAVFANPISYNVVLESSELDSNSTESLPVSQSAENDTSEIQSSEENTSDQSQSSESDSSESTSEDKTSEESDSQSDEDENNSLDETRDDSMGSEENVRKSWVREFASVIKALSAEDNSSTEVKGQSDSQSEKQASTAQGNAKLPMVESPTTGSDPTTSERADITALTAATSDSSESASSESDETSESTEDSDVSDDSNASDSSEPALIKGPACVNGTQSCESEEYFFQDIGDDAHNSVDNLMVPDEDERELFLKR